MKPLHLFFRPSTMIQHCKPPTNNRAHDLKHGKKLDFDGKINLVGDETRRSALALRFLCLSSGVFVKGARNRSLRARCKARALNSLRWFFGFAKTTLPWRVGLRLCSKTQITTLTLQRFSRTVRIVPYLLFASWTSRLASGERFSRAAETRVLRGGSCPRSSCGTV